MEEGETSNSTGIQEVEVQAGGVFWINSLGSSSGIKECHGQCSAGFQKAKKTVRPDHSWRRHFFPEDAGISTSNRYTPLMEAEKREERRCSVLAVEKGCEEVEGKIIIDSGAADSVIPKEILENAFPLMPQKEGLRFLAANGTIINNYGRRNVAFRARGHEAVNCMQFHVTDSKKTPASVGKIVEQGNSVHFTPNGSYIEGPKGERVELVLEGGVYVIDAKFLTGFSRQV